MKKNRWGLYLVLFAYLTLGATYSVMVPIFEGPDEPGHFAYVNYLSEERRLPVQSFEYEQNIVVEGHQPPLYYLIASVVTSGIDMSDIANLRGNPQFSFEVKNAFVHSRDEGFPYRGAFLAVHLVRLLSVAMGAVTVAATCWIAERIFPHDSLIPLGAAGLTAFIPQFVFIHSVVNNDSLATMCGSLLLLNLIEILKGHGRTRDVVSLGFLLGLGLLAKASLLVLVPLSMAVIVLSGWREKSAAMVVGKRVSLTLSLALLLAGWWYGRNWALYGDPLAWKLWTSSYAPLLRPIAPTWLDLRHFVVDQFHSFWAVFGWMNLPVHLWIYRTLEVACLLAAVGLFFLIADWGRGLLPSTKSGGLLLLGSTVAAFWLPILRLVWVFDASIYQGRFMFPAISAISTLLVAGWVKWVPTRWERPLIYTIILGFFLFAALCPFLYIRPAYTA